jgi:hypothetical protein
MKRRYGGRIRSMTDVLVLPDDASLSLDACRWRLSLAFIWLFVG